MGSPGSTSITPPSTALIWPPATRTTPKPVFATPGSIPMTTIMGSDSAPALGRLHLAVYARLGVLSGDLLQNLGRDVEVRVDGLDVIVLVQGLHQAHHGTGVALAHLDDVLRLHGQLGRLDVHIGGLEGSAHRGEILGGADHLQRVSLAGYVLGSRVDRPDQVVLAVAVGVPHHPASLLEPPRDGAGLAQAPAVLVEGVPKVGA